MQRAGTTSACLLCRKPFYDACLTGKKHKDRVGSNNLNLSSADGDSVLLSRSALRDISAGLVHTAMVATKVVTAADVTGAVGHGGALVVGVVLLHVAWPCNTCA